MLRARRRFRWKQAACFFALVAAVWTPPAAFGDEPSGVASEIRDANTELWSQLGDDARLAASQVDAPPAGEAGRARAFRALGSIAAQRGTRLTLLLFDPFGDVAVWGGAGLLHAVSGKDSRTRPCGFAESAASVTLWCAEPLAAHGIGQWTILAGESFSKEGEPPVDGRNRGRFRVTDWRLVPEPDAIPRLEIDGAELRRSDPDPSRALRAAAAVVAIALAVRALAGRRRKRTGLLPFALALGAYAAGSGWLAAAALGLAAAAVHAADAARRNPATLAWRIRLSWVAAALVGPALLILPEALGAELAHHGSQPLFGSATTVVFRLATALLVFAALWLGSGRRDGDAAPNVPAWIAGSIALALAAAFSENAGLTVVLLAAAGLVGAIGSGRLGEGRASATIATGVVAAILAGAAATATASLRERSGAPELVARLVPPSRSTMDEKIEAMERAIEAVATQTLAEMPALSLPPSDLAYAIWRRSPLARSDARSAIAVGRPGYEPSIFAYGLPIDDGGRLDPAPVRWSELDPSVWREREVAGELDVEGRESARWRLRWTLVPRPGFADPPPPVGDLAAGLLRGTTLGALPELPAGEKAAIYGSDGEPLVSPWSEGTPALNAGWLEPGARSRVETPDGPALVYAAAGEGVTAVLFEPSRRWSVPLESVGSFAAATLVIATALASVGLFLALGFRGVAVAVRRIARSYSQRLLFVFGALVLVPTVLLYALLASGLERRLEREQESRARDALRSAQRVLGEYVLSLDPGFGVDTALDDRLLEWLARVVRHEVNLYWGSEIYASSKRELFSSGLSPGRIPGEIWEKIALGGELFARRTASAGRHDYLELYAPLVVPGEEGRQSQLVLALPLLAQQEELAAEVATVRRRVLLGTLALFGLLAASGVALARSFARPIQELVGGTRRIAEGATELGFRPGERELESLAEAIDQMAAKVAEGRARLLAEKGLVDRIVENVTAAVVGLDREGRVLLANRFARERLGAAPPDSFRASLEKAGLDKLASAFDSARPGVEAVATETQGPTGHDWTLVRIPLGAGEPAELVVVEDVTDVSRAQRLEAWAAMARIIAHEIKNPLTPIRLSAEHLREAWARDREHFEAVFDRCTSNILAQVEELRRTASEFSLYAEIPRSEKRHGELGEIVAEVVEGYRAAPPPGLSVRYHGPGRPLDAELDRRLVGRAVRNLIENALRAQANGGEVEVEVGGKDGLGFVRVSDRGPGVAPELLGRIVEPYFSTQAGGTGLGLPIARRVAAEHGGELSVRNRPGGGFEVTITIPVG